jgi:hypothetical protein
VKPPLLSGDRVQRLLALVVLLAGLGSVAPLLTWVYGLGPFSAWFWLQAMPGLIAIAVIGAWAASRGDRPSLAVAITAGVLGGILGTILYDVSRMPFLAVGYRLFAPISSYGVLMIDASHSDRLTEALGWFYNFANGTAFGIAYAMVGLGRRWWWAIPWALWLETMTVVTPYAGVYGIAGKPDVIVIAYGAHVFYGLGLGVICERAARWHRAADAWLPPGPSVLAVIAAIVLLVQPWVVDPDAVDAASVSKSAVVVRDGRFHPEWVRIPPETCVDVANRDASAYELPSAGIHLPAASTVRYCPAGGGIQRVQLSGIPYSGGFVLIDPAMAPEALP